MHFKMLRRYRDFYGNIMQTGGSHSTDKKKFFSMFDIYYCCALVGMVYIQQDGSTEDLQDVIESYPEPYKNSRGHIAGLLIATEMKRNKVGYDSKSMEAIMMDYLDNFNDTLLSDTGVKVLNAYALRGGQILEEFLDYAPVRKEDFVLAFRHVLQHSSDLTGS